MNKISYFSGWKAEQSEGDIVSKELMRSVSQRTMWRSPPNLGWLECDLSKNEIKTLFFEEYKTIQHSNIIKKLKDIDKNMVLVISINIKSLKAHLENMLVLRCL